MDKKCPKCGANTLSLETHGMGVWERHVRCWTCGLLHVLGAVQDSIQRQVDPVGFERVMQKRIGGKVQISD